MFWADRIAKEIEDTPRFAGKRPLIVRDEKTLSGRVHIGSMRGVAIHGVLSEVLKERGVENTYLYELNDFDPFDTVPGYLDQEKFKEHLGKPLYTVPSPEAGFVNYAEFYGADFISVHEKAGFRPTYYRTYADLYKPGKMDTYIKTALTRAADVRRIYKEVSGSVKTEDWLPVSVVCEKCGKMMTTRAFDFDGETVGYACDRSPDDTVPCGHTGRVAPWKGAAKLHWKVDWAAKWVAVGVDIEGAGKDHSTKGGARDVSNHIAKELFDYQSPFDVPYEFFLVGGKKMSSSKGRGSSAKDISDLFPSAMLRYALIGKDITQQINVDPTGDSVPVMYDEYDKLGEHLRTGAADDYTRLFTLAQLPENQAAVTAPWQMRFRDVAFSVQMPHMDLVAEAVAQKGSELTNDEKIALTERGAYAQFWLEAYAPEQFVYKLQESLPAIELSADQKKALAVLAAYMSEPRTGEEIHAKLHEMKTEVPIAPKELFQALYRVFLNRDSGPKAGWFLGSLPREFVHERLSEASH